MFGDEWEGSFDEIGTCVSFTESPLVSANCFFLIPSPAAGPPPPPASQGYGGGAPPPPPQQQQQQQQGSFAGRFLFNPPPKNVPQFDFVNQTYPSKVCFTLGCLALLVKVNFCCCLLLMPLCIPLPTIVFGISSAILLSLICSFLFPLHSQKAMMANRANLAISSSCSKVCSLRFRVVCCSFFLLFFSLIG